MTAFLLFLILIALVGGAGAVAGLLRGLFGGALVVFVLWILAAYMAGGGPTERATGWIILGSAIAIFAVIKAAIWANNQANRDREWR